MSIKTTVVKLLLVIPIAASLVSVSTGETSPIAFAAQGRIEGAGAPVSLGFTISGRVQEICCREGDAITAGQVLQTLECGEERAAAAAADATLEALRNKYIRATRGARAEERAVAAARERAQQAELQDAMNDFGRVKRLFEQGNLASKREYDQVQRRLSVAQAASNVAAREVELVNAKLLPEEDAKFVSEIKAAESERRGAAARVAQCSLMSPVSGILLRRHVEVGETVSTFAPRVSLTVVDTSKTRVRVEVDERDILQVWVGQSTAVSMPNSSQQAYSGKVVWMSPVMGRKSVRGTDPAEKSDQDVREVLLQLTKHEPGLPIGMRVAVRFFNSAR